MTKNTLFYAVARNLKGFRTTSLRVRVYRVDGSNAWVETADLADAGTLLVLDVNQIDYLSDADGKY